MSDKQKVKIIGAGGFAKELTGYIADNNKVLDQKVVIEGYFDINSDSYDKYQFEAPFLGSEKDYNFEIEDIVLIAIGDTDVRNKVIEALQSVNVTIGQFIHHTSMIDQSANLGEGNIICPFCIIGPMTKVGSYNLINYHCAVPHDCEIGDGNVFSPNVQLTGFTMVGSGNLFGVSSGTVPSVTIGNGNKIQAGLMIDKTIKDNSIVFTMPSIKTMGIYNK